MSKAFAKCSGFKLNTTHSGSKEGYTIYFQIIVVIDAAILVLNEATMYNCGEKKDHSVFLNFLLILRPGTTEGKFVWTNTMLQFESKQESTLGLCMCCSDMKMPLICTVGILLSISKIGISNHVISCIYCHAHHILLVKYL